MFLRFCSPWLELRLTNRMIILFRYCVRWWKNKGKFFYHIGDVVIWQVADLYAISVYLMNVINEMESYFLFYFIFLYFILYPFSQYRDNLQSKQSIFFLYLIAAFVKYSLLKKKFVTLLSVMLYI